MGHQNINHLRTLIIDICGWVTCILVVFFFGILFLLVHNETPHALKESFAITATFSAGLTTLVSVLAVIYTFSSNYQLTLQEINRQQEELTKLAQPIVFIKLAKQLQFEDQFYKMTIQLFNSGAEAKDIKLTPIQNNQIHFDFSNKNGFVLSKSSQYDFEHDTNAGFCSDLIFDQNQFNEQILQGFQIEFELSYYDARNLPQKQYFQLDLKGSENIWQYSFQTIS
ncbi:MAG: hypothetical protein Q4F77_06690 [Acinetobacter sp.]|uniref:hypothetical protein n=1 Tax=Acinetobacter sp. TaxID=472 RepID=UPI0026E0F10B|nr:hypothetical protein [Acinetobacter sp.]MDO5542982.1 hypothetical protein [Acinetobacter sp.]